MVGAVERIRDGLIDRDRHGLRRGIDVVAAVNGDRLALHVLTSASCVENRQHAPQINVIVSALGAMSSDGDDAGARVVGGDRVAAKAWVRALELTAPIPKNPDRVLSTVIDELAEKFGEAPALLSDRERLTYRTLAERANRYARWALDQSVRKGDAVCLLMPNRPEYMAIWLGITRVGGIVALLNTNLVGPSLAHCINIVEPRHIIIAEELITKFAIARPHLVTEAKVWTHGHGRGEFPNIERDIDARSGTKLDDAERRPVTIAD